MSHVLLITFVRTHPATESSLLMHVCQNNSFNFTYTVSYGVELGVISGRNTNQQHPSCIELVVKIKGNDSACIRLGILWLEESSHTDTVTELT